MASRIYVGTYPPVDAAGTQSLLRTHQAIWCPGTSRPAAGDRLWLVWRAQHGGQVLLLGGGTLVDSDVGIFWTVRHDAGMRDEARALGYTGPDSMRFLRVQDFMLPNGVPPAVAGLGMLANGLNDASTIQEGMMRALLPIARGDGIGPL